MFNFTKTQINLIILEILIIAAGIGAILFYEIKYRSDVKILPPVKTLPPKVSLEDYTLPSAERISEITERAKRAKEKEITIEIVDEPAKPKLKDVLKFREEKPQEFTIELEDVLTPDTTPGNE